MYIFYFLFFLFIFDRFLCGFVFGVVVLILFEFENDGL